MRLFIFNCLLLASVAVALPNGYKKRDPSHPKNLIKSDIFGRSQINIQPEPVLQEENEYKLFHLPGHDDIMIKVAAKKPVVEQFVYPPGVEKEIRPLEEKVKLKVPLEPTYSYKIQNNGSVMTYTAYNKPGEEVIDTINMKTELPMIIKKQVDEAIVLGADSNRFDPVQKVFQRQNPQFFEFSYPRVLSNLFVQNSFREKVSTGGFGTVTNFGFPTLPLRPLSKDSPVLYYSRQTKTIYLRPISASKDKVNTTQSGASNRNMTQMEPVPIVDIKDTVSDANISVNVSKLQVNPNKEIVIKEHRGLRTNTFRYVIIAAVNSQDKNVEYNVTANRESVGGSTNAPKLPSRDSIQTSIIHKSTALGDNTFYSYLKTTADGSSLNITGDKHGISVDVIENNNRARGDIPDQ